MIEPIVVPFLWFFVFVLVVAHDADRHEDRTHHH